MNKICNNIQPLYLYKLLLLWEFIDFAGKTAFISTCIRKKILFNNLKPASVALRDTRPSGPSGDHLCWSGNNLKWSLIMKYYLQFFSPLHWFKKSASGKRMCPNTG